MRRTDHLRSSKQSWEGGFGDSEAKLWCFFWPGLAAEWSPGSCRLRLGLVVPYCSFGQQYLSCRCPCIIYILGWLLSSEVYVAGDLAEGPQSWTESSRSSEVLRRCRNWSQDDCNVSEHCPALPVIMLQQSLPLCHDICTALVRGNTWH